MTKNMSDRARLQEAFKALRKRGWKARMNFLCCDSCAWAELDAKDDANVVFFNKQANEAFDGDCLLSNLFLAWSGNAYELVGVLTLHGFTVTWEGDEGKKVCVQAPVD